MDLLAVFDLTATELVIFSYEGDSDIATKATRCPVFRALQRIGSIKVRVVPKTFPDGMEILETFRDEGAMIYFLDYFGTFGVRDARTIGFLLESRLLRDRDYLLITSCLTPRVVHQPNFMSIYTN